jgi:hypothetical protein
MTAATSAIRARVCDPPRSPDLGIRPHFLVSINLVA